MIDEKDLRTLPPDERIKKLREVTEQDKKEIEEAQRLITESELEAETDRVRKLQLPIDQLKAVDMSQLSSDISMSEEAKIMFREKRFIQSQKNPSTKESHNPSALEEMVKEGPSRAPQGQTHVQREYLKSLTANQIEKRAEYLQHLGERGYLSDEHHHEIYNMNKEVEYRRDLVNRGIYQGEGDINRVLDTTGNILRKLYNL